MSDPSVKLSPEITRQNSSFILDWAQKWETLKPCISLVVGELMVMGIVIKEKNWIWIQATIMAHLMDNGSIGSVLKQQLTRNHQLFLIIKFPYESTHE